MKMLKISCQQCCSHQKSHIQCKQQSTREDIEKDISSSIGNQNISVEDNSCLDTDNDIEKMQTMMLNVKKSMMFMMKTIMMMMKMKNVM
jgi:hypothetical protein